MPYKNKEDQRKSQLRYKERNPDKYKSYHIENPQVQRISQWKHMKIKLRPNEDWLSVYLFWKTCEECENCGIELTDGMGELTCRNLDHDHETGFIRDVLCWGCNIQRY